MLLASSVFPDTTEFHHVTKFHHVVATSYGKLFIDGYEVSTYAQGGDACTGGVVSFSLANDQDGLSYVNDPNQATHAQVSGLTVWNAAWSQAQVQQVAFGTRCSRMAMSVDFGSVWAEYYGDDGKDRSGNNNDGSLVLAPSSGTVSGGRGCIGIVPPSLPFLRDNLDAIHLQRLQLSHTRARTYCRHNTNHDR